MLTYNTNQKPLRMPEYGRNIQQMVDHCLTIEDRDERSRCARSIIKSMGNLFPELRNGEENQKKLWGHLAIMSGFKLDIDYPYEIINEEDLATRPDKVAYSTGRINRRHYGKAVEQLIEKASAMEDGEERKLLVNYIANHLKKLMLAVNKDGVDDAKVFKDLAEMSHGRIRLNPETDRLHEFQQAPQPASGKKKKKRK